MRQLTNEELFLVKGGGAIKIGIAFAIAAGVSFLIGVIDGIVRPLRCR